MSRRNAQRATSGNLGGGEGGRKTVAEATYAAMI